MELARLPYGTGQEEREPQRLMVEWQIKETEEAEEGTHHRNFEQHEELTYCSPKYWSSKRSFLS